MSSQFKHVRDQRILQIPTEPFATQELLKEPCHEDFSVLGQFCAKIITLRL